MSADVIDLREPAWVHENDLLEVNGRMITAIEAMALINTFPQTRHLLREVVDASLVLQAASQMEPNQRQFEAFRDHIVDARIDDWWDVHRRELDMVTCAWITLIPSSDVPLRVLVGNLASNPSAAIVSARCEGRRGAFIECDLGDLGEEFAPLRDSEIGAVVPLNVDGPAIGLVIDRAEAVLNEATRAYVATRVLQDWLSEQRAMARVRWIWSETTEGLASQDRAGGVATAANA